MTDMCHRCRSDAQIRFDWSKSDGTWKILQIFSMTHKIDARRAGTAYGYEEYINYLGKRTLPEP